MTILQAIFQGILQGLTEFLPVSSSGHLSIYQYFTGLSGETGAFFSIALHLGTLFSVFIAFWPTIVELIVEFFYLLADLFTGKIRRRPMNPKRRMICMLFLSLLPLAAVVVLKDFYGQFSADNDIIVEGVCLMATGTLLFLAERAGRGRKNSTNMTNRDALAVGVAQAIAPLPGVSRSGSTIAVGRLMGLDKQYAITYSFILGIPAVLGAVILEVPDVMKEGLSLPVSVLITGVVTSLVFGLLAIKLVRWLMAGDKFVVFAYYTLIVGVLVVGAGVFELFSGHTLQRLVMGLMA